MANTTLLNSLGPIQLDTPTQGQTVAYDAAAGFWKNHTVAVVPDTVSFAASSPLTLTEAPTDTFTVGLPTTATPQVAGLGIGTPGEANALTFSPTSGGSIKWGNGVDADSSVNFGIDGTVQLSASAGSPTLLVLDPTLAFFGPISGSLNLGGDGTVSGLPWAIGYINTLTRDSGDLTLSTTTSGGIRLIPADGSTVQITGGTPEVSTAFLGATVEGGFDFTIQDATDAANLVNLFVRPWGVSSDDTTFYLQRSLLLNSIIALYGNDDEGSALFDVYAPITGTSSSHQFTVRLGDGPQSIELIPGDSDFATWGAFYVTGGALFSRSPYDSSGKFQTPVEDGSNSAPTLVTKLNTAQTANLFEAQDASGVALVAIDVTGSVSASSYTASALPSSDAGLTAGQFYHTAGAVMVKL